MSSQTAPSRSPRAASGSPAYSAAPSRDDGISSSIGQFCWNRWQELLYAPSVLLGYHYRNNKVPPRDFWQTAATVAVCGGTLTAVVGTGVYYYYYRSRKTHPRHLRNSTEETDIGQDTLACDGGEVDRVTLVPRLVQERILVEGRGEPPEPLKESIATWDADKAVQREPYTGEVQSSLESGESLFSKFRDLISGLNTKTEDPVQRRNRQLMVMFFVLLSFQVLVTTYIGFRFRFSPGSIDDLAGPLNIQKAIFPVLAIGSTLMIAKAVLELSPGHSVVQENTTRTTPPRQRSKAQETSTSDKTTQNTPEPAQNGATEEAQDKQKSVRETIAECDALHRKQECEKEEKSLRLLLERTTDTQELAEIEWRIGRASNARANLMCFQNGGAEKESKNQRESRIAVIREGYDHVIRSLELNEDSSDANKWAAVLLAQYGGSLQDSIKNAYKIREYARRCVDLNPNDPQGYYILGTWAYEVSKVGWWERKLATAIFGEPPSATIEEALEYFQKAESLESGFWMVNRLKIAQCLHSLNRIDEAKEWLLKSKELEHTLDEDRWGLHERDQLEKKLF